jgi:hypothetical protein
MGGTVEAGYRRSVCVNARDGQRFDEAIYSLLRSELSEARGGEELVVRLAHAPAVWIGRPRFLVA